MSNQTENFRSYIGLSFVISSSRLTSPAEGTGQLTAQESTSDDSDGFDVSGDLVKFFEVLDLQNTATCI